MLKKIEKVKLLLKYLEKYGFDTSGTTILTKKGNLNRDASWYNYEVGHLKLNTIGDFEIGSEMVFSIEGHEITFTITAGYSVLLPIVCHIHNFKVPKYFINAEMFDWSELETEDDIEYIIKNCADKIEQMKKNDKEFSVTQREQKMNKDFK
jgi:hypothetical protein